MTGNCGIRLPLFWALIASLFVIGTLCTGAVLAAEDLGKCIVDGALLTRNWDARYVKATPVGASVAGKTAEEAVFLVDGDRHGASGLSWGKGDKAQITIDLQQKQMVAAICMAVNGDAGWSASISPDGKNWDTVSTAFLHRSPDHIVIPNLAHVARFVRITALPTSERLSIGEIFIYGEKNSIPSAIGGIYASSFPPVAGRSAELRAVVRNTTSRAMTNVRVRFSIKSPGSTTDAQCLVKGIPPGQSALAVVPWTPRVCEPHRVLVSIGSTQRQETMPVVNRSLYFGCFNPPNYDHHPILNLYTCISGGPGDDAPQYLFVKLHGGIPLANCDGPTVMRDTKTADGYEKAWLPVLQAPYRDGISMDEWGHPNAEAIEALKRIHDRKGDKIIATWMATRLSEPYYPALLNADLVILETYCNMMRHGNWPMGHSYYYAYIKGQQIDYARKGGLLDRSLIALGYFVDSRPTIPEELEREVRYTRLCAPEMPGIAYYGSPWRPSARIMDDLSYKYFISPVLRVTNTSADGLVDVANIGGMNAHSVKVGLYSVDGKKLSDETSVDVPAGGAVSVKLAVPAGTVRPQGRVIPAKAYTVLEDKPLEVLPPVQVKGNPLQAFWSSDREKIDISDRVDFVNAVTGKVVQTVKSPDTSDFTFISRHISTDDFAPGDYEARLIDGVTGDLKAIDRISLAASLGKLYASAVNGVPWKGDPQRIEVKSGDTFEIRWDLEDGRIPGPVVCISAPGDPLRMPLPDGAYAYADIARFNYMANDPDGDPFLNGSWTWKTNLQADDFLSNEDFNGMTALKAWIRDGKALNAANPKVNMSLTPGEWKLWLATESDVLNTWAAPKSPVLTVVVK